MPLELCEGKGQLIFLFLASTGTVGLVCTSIGVLSSGIVTSRIKPRASYLAFWNVITVLFDVIGHFLFIYIGCQKEDLHGSSGLDGRYEKCMVLIRRINVKLPFFTIREILSVKPRLYSTLAITVQ